MSAGTITLTNGSAIVGGSGTSFATELAGGDFIVSTVGGVPYTLPVKTVDSNTQLTLVSNYTGPTQSGAAWSAVPRVALNMVTAALVAQTTEALRGQNYDKANWQAVFSASGDITVMLPDGSTFTGPSWNKIAELLNNINSKLGYALVDFGTVGVYSRYVRANPFGNSTPVICQVEIYFNGKWGAPGWVSWYSNPTMNAYGLTGGMVLGEGLVVQTARSYLEDASYNVGSLLGTTAGSVTSVPCRMHVWKLVP